MTCAGLAILLFVAIVMCPFLMMERTGNDAWLWGYTLHVTAYIYWCGIDYESIYESGDNR